MNTQKEQLKVGKSQVHMGDCLEEMKSILDGSIDMILCDLPYGSIACKWDTVIPFEPLWEQYKRIIKDNGAIVLTASQPFATALVSSNIKEFKYETIWEKSSPSNFMNAAYMPNFTHENIYVFSNGTARGITYNPNKIQISERYWDKRSAKARTVEKSNNADSTNVYNITGKASKVYTRRKDEGWRYPDSVIPCKSHWSKGMHPTQKPVALFEYLIKTYTNEGETVLDNCAGSFTTAIACINTNRKSICIEKDEGYFKMGVERIEAHIKKRKDEASQLSLL